MSDYDTQRERMVKEQIAGRGVMDRRVLEAFREVPRHKFVSEKYLPDAYSDHPVPIGHNQTISQPYIVAYMTEQLDVPAAGRTLEIGTGSGYQAAILSRLSASVFTIETVEALFLKARRLFQTLGLDNICTYFGDGYDGLAGEGPFDRIMITAAAPRIPEALVDQLADGGKMILPAGTPHGYQELISVEKHHGRTTTRSLLGVRFVPMTGKIQRPVRS